MKKIIGVMGAANIDEISVLEMAHAVGEEIALNDCYLLTGATTGIPLASVNGAKSRNGFVVGISPAANRFEHQKTYNKPIENHDIIIYTGAGYQARNLINIRSCDALIFINGGIGTLNEFTIAVHENKIIGILKGSGGITDEFESIFSKLYQKYNCELIIETDPVILVNKVMEKIK